MHFINDQLIIVGSFYLLRLGTYLEIAFDAERTIHSGIFRREIRLVKIVLVFTMRGSNASIKY